MTADRRLPFPAPALAPATLTRRGLLGLALGGLGAAAWPARAAGAAAAAPIDGEVCHGDAVSIAPGVKRTLAPYPVPGVTLTRADGVRVPCAEALDESRPVLLNFIYTSCSTICPVTSQVFMQTRELLGREREAVAMVSVSIDPEQDTPRRLAAYARKYAAAGAWAHYTGSSAESLAVQRAFAAWRGDKMNHLPLTLLRPARSRTWVRLDGFATPELIVAELRKFG